MKFKSNRILGIYNFKKHIKRKIVQPEKYKKNEAMLFYVDLMLVESKLSFNINLLSVIGLCTLHKLCVLCSLNKFIGSKWCSSRTYLGP